MDLNFGTDLEILIEFFKDIILAFYFFQTALESLGDRLSGREGLISALCAVSDASCASRSFSRALRLLAQHMEW